MRKLLQTALLLIFALAICGFGSCGRARPPLPQPKLTPAPASLMVKPSYESKARLILFDSPQKPTPKSAASKP